jgi:hypothetical protein
VASGLIASTHEWPNKDAPNSAVPVEPPTLGDDRAKIARSAA